MSRRSHAPLTSRDLLPERSRHPKTNTLDDGSDEESPSEKGSDDEESASEKGSDDEGSPSEKGSEEEESDAERSLRGEDQSWGRIGQKGKGRRRVDEEEFSGDEEGDQRHAESEEGGPSGRRRRSRNDDSDTDSDDLYQEEWTIEQEKRVAKERDRHGAWYEMSSGNGPCRLRLIAVSPSDLLC